MCFMTVQGFIFITTFMFKSYFEYSRVDYR